MLLLSLLVVPVVLFCIGYLDQPLARWIMGLIRSSLLLQQTTSLIPDLLLTLVCLTTAGMWLLYFFRRPAEACGAQFLKVTATALPAAYALKSLLQFSFGRTNTRHWLLKGVPLEFNWFNGIETGCFPSGHMTVFTSFFVALCLYYPQYRPVSAVLLLLLGTALVATDYHFLSDVVAGAYLGMLITYTTQYLLTRPPRP